MVTNLELINLSFVHNQNSWCGWKLRFIVGSQLPLGSKQESLFSNIYITIFLVIFIRVKY
jgi:hypothetical protein